MTKWVCSPEWKPYFHRCVTFLIDLKSELLYISSFFIIYTTCTRETAAGCFNRRRDHVITNTLYGGQSTCLCSCKWSTFHVSYVQTVCTRNFINHWMLLLGVGILQCLSWFLRTATLWPLHVRPPQDSFSSTGSPESLLVCFRLWGSVLLWKGQGCLFTASLESPGNYRLHEKLFTWGILSSWMIMT